MVIDGRGHGPDHGNRAPAGRDPSDDHGPLGRVALPSNLRRTASHHDEASPRRRQNRGVWSNTLHAICNGVPPDTNSLLPTRTGGQGLTGERVAHEGVAADQ